jgi:hypothetical protein
MRNDPRTSRCESDLANYRRTFGAEMPHPKMDAVVASLADAW